MIPAPANNVGILETEPPKTVINFDTEQSIAENDNQSRVSAMSPNIEAFSGEVGVMPETKVKNKIKNILNPSDSSE